MPTKLASSIFFCVQLELRKLSLYEVAGCLQFRGYGRTVRTSSTVCYIIGVRCSTVSIKQGSTVKDNGKEELHYINTDTRADR